SNELHAHDRRPLGPRALERRHRDQRSSAHPILFTLPAELRVVAKLNRRAVFDAMFAAAGATLVELGLDPKRLGDCSASPPCCTRGGATWRFIRTSIASSRAGAGPPSSSVGVRRAPAISCPSQCSAACSEASYWLRSAPCTMRESFG